MSSVTDTNIAYQEMIDSWDLIDDLLGGTFAMRKAATKWLPREDAEEPAKYQTRLQRSILFGGLKNSIGKIVSRPFSRPTVLVENIPARIESLKNNMNGNRETLTEFAKSVFETGIKYGLAHIIVDFPVSGGTGTLEQEKQSGANPIFAVVTPRQVLGWKLRENSKDKLEHVRISEMVRVPDGEWGEKEIEQVRVYYTDRWELYRQNENGEWATYQKGDHTFGEVPIITLYIEKKGFMQGKSPMEDLAFLNLAHWISSSDQRNILRYARLGLLFASGMAEDEVEKVVLSPTSLIHATSKDAKLEYVEHTGRAMTIGAKDIKSLEEQMEVLGMQPFLEKAANTTATSKVLEDGKIQSDIHRWIRSCEFTLTQAFHMAAKWVKLKLPEKFKVEIFSDFSIATRTSKDVEVILRMRQMVPPLISRRQAAIEIQRRGVLQETVNVDEMLETAESEMDDLMSLIGEKETDVIDDRLIGTRDAG